MDVEKAVEFLIEGQARHEAHLQHLDARLNTIANVIRGGLKAVVRYQVQTNQRFEELLDAQLRTEANIARLADAQVQLAEAQTRTEKELRSLTESLKHPRNGHGE